MALGTKKKTSWFNSGSLFFLVFGYLFKNKFKNILFMELPISTVFFGMALFFLVVSCVYIIKSSITKKTPWTRLLMPGIGISVELIFIFSNDRTLATTVGLILSIFIEILILGVAILALFVRNDSFPEKKIEIWCAKFMDGKLAKWVSIELISLVYGLMFIAGGFLKALPKGFSYHSSSHIKNFLIAIPFLIPIDIIVLGYVFQNLSPLIIIIIRALSIYGFIVLLGYWFLQKSRPHTFEEGKLILNNGCLTSREIHIHEIVGIGREAHDSLNVVNKDFHVEGCPKVYLEIESSSGEVLIVSVDDPEKFIEGISSARGLS